jgi:hypothetical protein
MYSSHYCAMPKNNKVLSKESRPFLSAWSGARYYLRRLLVQLDIIAAKGIARAQTKLAISRPAVTTETRSTDRAPP